jgi:hypothetical protein
MKILKIVLVLLIPALGFVGCQKSEMKPRCGNHSTSESTNKSDDAQASGKFGDLIVEEETGGTIVGSGDDDRDGGDKPKKGGR